MTREQEIKEMAKVKASHITSDKDMQVAFADALRSGAEWADEHPVNYDGKAMLYVNNKSHENGYNEAVNKACDLLRDLDVFTEDFINDFRKAMKGGEE